MSFCWQFHRALNRLARIMKISLLYHTSKGVKYLNPLMRSIKLCASEPFVVEPDQLFIGFDALADQYTLVGENLLHSPHYGLMEALENGNDPRQTDYCKRYQNGTLDTRSPTPLTKGVLENFAKTFQKRKQEILAGVCEPVQVYRIGEKLYLADGKHRAALCALLGQPIRCEEIGPDYLNDSFRRWMYDAMCRKASRYQCNISLFQQIDRQNVLNREDEKSV